MSTTSLIGNLNANLLEGKHAIDLYSGVANLMVGSYRYTEDDPYVLSGYRGDYYEYLPDLYFMAEAGETYIISCETDGVWHDHVGSGDPENRYCSFWLYNGAGHFSFGANMPNVFTAPVTGKYWVRFNLYSDGETTLTVRFWNVKAEKGRQKTDFLYSIYDPWSSAQKLSTGRALTIGNSSKTFDGSENIIWSLSDIGINTTNFPGINSTGTVTGIILKAGSGISLDIDNTAITTSGTRTISNSGVRSVSISGDYLRVNTNGTSADLTIPYATSSGNSDTLDTYHHTKFLKIYTRSEIGDVPNFDDPVDSSGATVNGFFESRVRETPNATGTVPPTLDCTPMISLKSQYVFLQFVGQRGEYWIRGAQNGYVSGNNISWDKLVVNSGTWNISVTGSAGSVAWGNISGKPDTYAPSTHNHDTSYLKLTGGVLSSSTKTQTLTVDSTHSTETMLQLSRNGNIKGGISADDSGTIGIYANFSTYPRIKLVDNINPVYRYNYTDYTLWHSGNDGTGSGLDADLLDGHDSSYFATSDHNHNSSYVSSLGASGNNLTWTKNGTVNLVTVPYSNGSNTSNYSFFIKSRGSVDQQSGVQYITGQTKTGSADGNAYGGSSTNPYLLCFPENATAINSAGTENETANVSIFRIIWGASHWHDFHLSPNVSQVFHRVVFGSYAYNWEFLPAREWDGEHYALGSASKPVYINYNGKFAECNSYPTKSSWNYDDCYVSSLSTSGNNLTWTKNGTTNSITVPYSSDSDKLDGYHGSRYLFRQNRSDRSSIDCNNPAWFVCTELQASEIPITNSPTTGYGLLLSLADGNNYAKLQLVSSGEKLWFRAGHSSSSSITSDWCEIHHSGNLIQLTSSEIDAIIV